MAFLKGLFKKSKSAEDPKRNRNYDNINRNLDPSLDWEIISELGDGAFGKVYKTRKSNTGLMAALKRVDFDSEDELEDFMVEIDILTNFKHPNILTLHEVYIYDNKLWMYLELCGGGALDSIMNSLEKPLREPQIRFVCREVLAGLAFLHENLIIHRDLKAGNILLTLNDEVKLADFGVSAKLTSEKQKRDTFIGTPYWMAPEVITCETFRDNPYNWKADVWSFGITLIELAQILPPHNSVNPTRVLLKICRSDPPTLDKPHLWSREFNQIIARCLRKDFNERPECKELLTDPFVRDVCEKDRKTIHVLLCELKAEVIDTVEDLDLNTVSEEIKDRGLVSLVLPDSTKIRMPVESLGEDDEEDEDSHTIAIGNLNKPSQISPTVKATPFDVKKTDKKLLNSCLNDIVEEIIKEVITSDTHEPSIPSCIYNVMEELNEMYEKKSFYEPSMISIQKSNNNKPHPKFVMNYNQTKLPTSYFTGNNKESELSHRTPVIVDDRHPEPLKRQDSICRAVTRTRRFVVDGELVTTTSKRVVFANINERQKQDEELNKRKAALRAFRLLTKQEARQTRELNERAHQQLDTLSNKLVSEFVALRKTFDRKLEDAAKNYRLQLEHLDRERELEMKRIRVEADKETRQFKSQIKSSHDRKSMKSEPHDGSSHSNTTRSTTDSSRSLQILMSTPISVGEKLSRFREQQESDLNSRLYTVVTTYNERLAELKRADITERQNIRLDFEQEKCKLEQRKLEMLHQLERSRLSDMFIIKRQQLAAHSELELHEIKQTVNSERAKLSTIQAAERKNYIKHLKADIKKNVAEYERELRHSQLSTSVLYKRLREKSEVEQMHFDKQLSLFAENQQNQAEVLEKSIRARLNELEQNVIEKRNALVDQETAKLEELDRKYKKKIKNYAESLPRTKALLMEQFEAEMNTELSNHSKANWLSQSVKNTDPRKDRRLNLRSLPSVRPHTSLGSIVNPPTQNLSSQSRINTLFEHDPTSSNSNSHKYKPEYH